MENWKNRIDQTTNEFVKHFRSLTSEQLNWKPAALTWSIAQNIDHLMVINQTYFPVLADLKAGTYKPPFIARIGFLVSFFGNVLLNSVKPDRKRKTKTFPMWEPATSPIREDILERFKKHQALLKQQIDASAPLIEKGAIISSPVNRNIVYKLSTAFDIIVTHEQRHLEQAKEVLELLKKEPDQSLV